MAVSLRALQAEWDALRQLCPTLMPSVVPQGFDVEDLWGLVETEGKEQVEQFRATLKAACRPRSDQQAEASASACCVCGASGTRTHRSDMADDERQALRFTVLPSISITDRTVQLSQGGFACGSCRALLDPGRFLTFAASCSAPSANAELQQQRSSDATELCLHLASVNQAPAELQSNSQGVAMWSQEVVSRAYALQVVASNVEGWRVLGPEGQAVTQGTPGLSVTLLKALLRGPGKAKASRKKPEQQQASQIAHTDGNGLHQGAGKAGGGQKRKQEPAAPQQGSQSQHAGHATDGPARNKKVKTGTFSVKSARQGEIHAGAGVAGRQEQRRGCFSSACTRSGNVVVADKTWE